MIRKLARSIRQYKRDTILTPLSMTLEVIMEVLLPIIMADLIDNGISAGNSAVIWRDGLLLAGVSILSLLSGLLGGVFGAVSFYDAVIGASAMTGRAPSASRILAQSLTVT